MLSALHQHQHGQEQDRGCKSAARSGGNHRRQVTRIAARAIAACRLPRTADAAAGLGMGALRIARARGCAPRGLQTGGPPPAPSSCRAAVPPRRPAPQGCRPAPTAARLAQSRRRASTGPREGSMRPCIHACMRRSSSDGESSFSPLFLMRRAACVHAWVSDDPGRPPTSPRRDVAWRGAASTTSAVTSPPLAAREPDTGSPGRRSLIVHCLAARWYCSYIDGRPAGKRKSRTREMSRGFHRRLDHIQLYMWRAIFIYVRPTTSVLSATAA